MIFKGVDSEPKQVSIVAVHRGLRFDEFNGENNLENLVISPNNQFLENLKKNILDITNLNCIGLGRVPTGQPDMSGRQSNKKYCTQKKPDTKDLAKIRFITTNNDNCQYDASSSLVNMGEWVLDSSEAYSNSEPRGVFYLHTR